MLPFEPNDSRLEDTTGPGALLALVDLVVPLDLAHRPVLFLLKVLADLAFQANQVGHLSQVLH